MATKKTQLIKNNLKIDTHPGTSFFAAVIILEILYLATRPLNVTRIKFRNIFGSFKEYKIIFLILLSMIIGFVVFFSRVMRLPLALLLAVFFVTAFLLVNETMHIHFPNKRVNAMTMEECLRDAKTGDFLICGVPRVSDNLFYLVPTPLVGIMHIGLVVKGANDSSPHLVDCMEKTRFCEYNKRVKTGVMMRPLADHLSYLKTKNYYLIQNHWNATLDEKRIMSVFDRYKDVEYFENNMNCISFVLLLLQELDLIMKPYQSLPLYIHFNRLLDPAFYRVPFDYHVKRITKKNET